MDKNSSPGFYPGVPPEGLTAPQGGPTQVSHFEYHARILP